MIKRLTLTLTLLIAAFGALAQEAPNTAASNFSVVNNSIVWQKVFTSSLTYNELLKSVIASGVFEKIDTIGHQIAGQSKQFDMDYKGAGFSSSPIYIRDSHFRWHTTIECKDGRYRVTVRNIEMEQSYSNPMFKQGQKDYLDNLFVKNGQIKGSLGSWPKSDKIIDYTFTKLFTFTKQTDNW